MREQRIRTFAGMPCRIGALTRISVCWKFRRTHSVTFYRYARSKLTRNSRRDDRSRLESRLLIWFKRRKRNSFSDHCFKRPKVRGHTPRIELKPRLAVLQQI